MVQKNVSESFFGSFGRAVSTGIAISLCVAAVVGAYTSRQSADATGRDSAALAASAIERGSADRDTLRAEIIGLRAEFKAYREDISRRIEREEQFIESFRSGDFAESILTDDDFKREDRRITERIRGIEKDVERIEARVDSIIGYLERANSK